MSETLVEKKKRGRKPKNKDITINNKKDSLKLINFNSDNTMNNMVVHLPLKVNDIIKITNNNDINIEKYIQKKEEINLNIDINDNIINNELVYNNCEKCNSLLQRINELIKENENLKKGILDYSYVLNKKIHDCGINFIENNNKKNIVCWWCCHHFDNIPLGIPENIYKNNYYIYGNFCSFNCMMAYNIDLNDYKIWDRQANIYKMKNRIDKDNKFTIQPAPPRQVLNIFGGPCDIKDYRKNFFLLNQEYRFILPPMISLISIIEENYKYNNSISNYIKKPYISRKKPLPKQGNLGINL